MTDKTIEFKCPYCKKSEVLTVPEGILFPNSPKRICAKCHTRKMAVQDIEDTSRPTCPECGTLVAYSEVCMVFDGDTQDFTCKRCGHQYVSTLSLLKSYSNTNKEENNDTN